MSRLSFLKYVFLVGAFISFGLEEAFAQEVVTDDIYRDSVVVALPLDVVDKINALDSITAPWSEWETASISGKLKMNGLPVSPSVKIYMQKDSCISISLRAPFMGEVGRAEIYGDTLLIVDKMHKTFVRQPLEEVLSYYPGTLSDIQNLLLGRAFIPGFGLLSSSIAEALEIYRESDDLYSVTPTELSAIDGFNYGYMFNADWSLSALLVIPLMNPGTVVAVEYVFYDKSYDINVSFQNPEKMKTGKLELDYPVWDASPIAPVKINGRFRQVDFSDFMKSF